MVVERVEIEALIPNKPVFPCLFGIQMEVESGTRESTGWRKDLDNCPKMAISAHGILSNSAHPRDFHILICIMDITMNFPIQTPLWSLSLSPYFPSILQGTILKSRCSILLINKKDKNLTCNPLTSQSGNHCTYPTHC